VAELTGMLNLGGWPAGMRVIARKEIPHPGAQLQITDADGLRVTAFATNSVHVIQHVERVPSHHLRCGPDCQSLAPVFR